MATIKDHVHEVADESNTVIPSALSTAQTADVDARIAALITSISEDPPEDFTTYLVLVDSDLYVWDGAAYQGPYTT